MAAQAGVMITYCIIVADMLVGSAPEYQGVLPTMLGRHDGPWFLTRAFVVRGALAPLHSLLHCCFVYVRAAGLCW